NSASALR
ncbi:dehydrogenase E1 component family protein, partial [Chlamydia psittaci 84-8471/1]